MLHIVSVLTVVLMAIFGIPYAGLVLNLFGTVQRAFIF
jgi:hypothetical protein